MPCICLTGDVHHNCRPKFDLPIFDAKKLKFEEIQSETRKWEYKTAEEYWKIANRYNCAITLFVTGKSVEQHKAYWKSLSETKGVEVGAHTYAAMPHSYLHGLFNRTMKCYYGPPIYQRIDIAKALLAFEKIHLRPSSWRTHGYWGNRTTNVLLSKFGFKVVSDVCRLGSLHIDQFVNGPYNLKQVPINVVPDDRIFGFFCQRAFEKMLREGKRVQESIMNGIKRKKDMVLQLHPICMRILDNYQTYEQILNSLSENNYSSLTITSLAENCD